MLPSSFGRQRGADYVAGAFGGGSAHTQPLQHLSERHAHSNSWRPAARWWITRRAAWTVTWWRRPILLGNQSNSIRRHDQPAGQPRFQLSRWWSMRDRPPSCAGFPPMPPRSDFNVYRNGVKQNASLLATPTAYADSLPLGSGVLYGVTAVNNSAQESPPRQVNVSAVALGPAGRSAWAAEPTTRSLTGYFDHVPGRREQHSAPAAPSRWPNCP
jgi:hypothetical protein